jgi:predicted AlkP superfamily pyrophosphatase or phosphodiesterase
VTRRWILLLLAAAAFACAPSTPRPRLVVVLVVDQMRADYLDRFGPAFQGGLRRLLDEGVVFEACRFGTALTGTAPGHASIATGCDPRTHGVFEQVWFDRDHGGEVVFTEDARYPLLGGSSGPGVSPHRLRASTLGDWLKQASPASKVYATAIKARAAVALGGEHPDAVYWYDPDLPGLLTSRYYQDELPDWVTAFNGLGLLEQFASQGWSPLRPDRVDAAVEEGRGDSGGVPDGEDIPYGVFPHRLDEGIEREIRNSPFGDELTIRFAQRLLREEGLGQDDAVDLLWVGLSAEDYVGHRYGPYSLEVQDCYLRLDEVLQGFFATLDEVVGPDRVLVALTSDHGVAPIPERLHLPGVLARRVVWDDYLADLERVGRKAQAELGLDASPVLHANYEGLWLDLARGRPARGDREAPVTDGRLIDTLTRELLELPYVDEVFGPNTLQGPRPPAGSNAEAYWRSYVPGRGADLMLRFPPYWLVGTYPAGTNHGTPYEYDTHVPWILAGRGLRPRRIEANVEPIDVAPTFADLLGVPAPSSVDGSSRRALLAGD